MKVIPFLKSQAPHLRKAPEPYLTYLLGIQALFFGVPPVFLHPNVCTFARTEKVFPSRFFFRKKLKWTGI
jgi:hypothetical protein